MKKQINRKNIFGIALGLFFCILLVLAISACSNNRDSSNAYTTNDAQQNNPTFEVPSPNNPPPTLVVRDRPFGGYYYHHYDKDVWSRRLYFDDDIVRLYYDFLSIVEILGDLYHFGDLYRLDDDWRLMSQFRHREAFDAIYYAIFDTLFSDDFFDMNQNVINNFMLESIPILAGTFMVDENTQTINIDFLYFDSEAFRQSMYYFFLHDLIQSLHIPQLSPNIITEMADLFVRVIQHDVNEINSEDTSFVLEYMDNFDTLIWQGDKLIRRCSSNSSGSSNTNTTSDTQQNNPTPEAPTSNYPQQNSGSNQSAAPFPLGYWRFVDFIADNPDITRAEIVEAVAEMPYWFMVFMSEGIVHSIQTPYPWFMENILWGIENNQPFLDEFVDYGFAYKTIYHWDNEESVLVYYDFRGDRFEIEYNISGARLFIPYEEGVAFVFELTAPPASEPVLVSDIVGRWEINEQIYLAYLSMYNFPSEDVEWEWDGVSEGGYIYFPTEDFPTDVINNTFFLADNSYFEFFENYTGQFTGRNYFGQEGIMPFTWETVSSHIVITFTYVEWDVSFSIPLRLSGSYLNAFLIEGEGFFGFDLWDLEITNVLRRAGTAPAAAPLIGQWELVDVESNDEVPEFISSFFDTGSMTISLHLNRTGSMTLIPGDGNAHDEDIFNWRVEGNIIYMPNIPFGGGNRTQRLEYTVSGDRLTLLGFWDSHTYFVFERADAN